MCNRKIVLSNAAFAELTSYRSSTVCRKLYRAGTPKRNGRSVWDRKGYCRLSSIIGSACALMFGDRKRIWNRATHLRHVATQVCPSLMYSGLRAGGRTISKGLCLLRFVTSRFGHLLAQESAVGSVGMSLSVTGPKNQGNSGSAIVSGQKQPMGLPSSD